MSETRTTLSRRHVLLQFGASLVQEIECVDGVWTAVCERS